MKHTAGTGYVPGSVKAAAGLFVVSGLAGLLNATAMQPSDGWEWPRPLVWATVPLIGACVVAGGLVRGARWAWLAGIGLGALWLAAGAMAVVVIEHGDLFWLPPSGFQGLLVVSLGGLGVALALLLSPAARSAFGRPK